MKVGILDILCLPSRRLVDSAYHRVMTKQYSSITPQAVSVWCRQLGHETFYANYYGIGDPGCRIPKDVDFLFLSTYTQPAALAYALAKAYRTAGATTVIGGAHARSFPRDCLRFFDYVVKDCDKELIADLLAARFEPGTVVSSAKPYDDIPTVEERLPEIRASSFMGGKRKFFATAVPMLASMGCPYTCDFCVDWNNPYRQLSIERLIVDLRFLSKHLAGTPIGFHDPNFAVKFDTVLDAMEAIPPESRLPYMFETSPSILRAPRLERLKKTHCIAIVSGVESWVDYSNKAGVGRKETGREKIEKVLEHFRHIFEVVPYQQANFMVGLDSDEGREPVELTKEFISRTPYAWPALNIPVPFGGTPLFDRYVAKGRIHAAMPFAFYYSPYLATTLEHYAPITYYEMMIELTAHLASRGMLMRRLEISPHPLARIVYVARTIGAWEAVRSYRRILGRLKTDRSFLDFHEGRSKVLPDFYRHEFDELVGPYAALLDESDRTPDLEQDCPAGASSSPGVAA
jgi:radical SAM superfamily enzyme YgiQ (UPF0313 family)